MHDVSFAVRRGEVVGLFGLMGAGRTELLQTIFGLHPYAATGDDPRRRPAARYSLAGASHRSGPRPGAGGSQGRRARALDERRRKRQPARVSTNDAACGLLQPRRERELVGRFVERLAVKTPSLDELVRNLSGGNQQKVVLAKWLATEPEGAAAGRADPRHRRQRQAGDLRDHRRARRSGLGVVMVSSELPEILAIADRILVLAEGRLTAEFARGEATEESILKAALPADEQQAKTA